MTLMVALVGDQPLPNLLPVRYYHPDKVLLVYTQRTEPVYRRLEATLRQEAAVYGLQTDAYNIAAVIHALDDNLGSSEFANLPLVFNLTGGTKAMVLAAYQVAQRRNASIVYLESERKHSRIYRYVWGDHRQIELSASELLPECVKLKDLFDVYFGPKEWSELGPSRSEGGPFEVTLAEALRSAGYEVMIGIKAMDGQIDIDVAVRFENQFGIIEAKTGGAGKKLDGIKQLSNTVRHLGTYTQTFYAITVPPEPAHEAITAASRIRVVSLPSYVREAAMLSLDDARGLITIVDEGLKSPYLA